MIGEERLVATAGMFANMPVGTPHSFKNESSKPAKMAKGAHGSAKSNPKPSTSQPVAAGKPKTTKATGAKKPAK